MKLNPRTHLSLLLGTVSLLAAATTSTHAQDYTWTGAGGGTNNNWNTASNWDTAPAAPGSSTTRLIFAFSDGAATATSTNNLGSFTLNQLTFGANNTARTIGGNPLVFESDGLTAPSMLHNDSGQHTMSNAISIPSAELTLGGTVVAVATLNGAITGNGSIKVTGTTWVLSNTANTYAGGVTLNGSTPFPNLVLTGSSFGDVGAITSGSAGTGKITLMQGAIRSTQSGTPTVNNDVDISGNVQLGNSSPAGSKLTLGGNITLTGDTTRILTLSVSSGLSTISPVVLAGPIAGTGAASALTVTGAGTLELSGSGANTYTGLTTVNAGNTVLLLNKTGVEAIAGNLLSTGTVRLGQANQIADTAVVELTGGTFDLFGNSETLGALKGGAASINSSVAGNSTLTIAGSGVIVNDTTAAITDGSGTVSLVKNGAQMLILRGTSTYSGGTTLNQGEIAMVNTSPVGTGTITLNGGIFRTQDATPQTLANNLEIGGNVNLGIGSTNATITFNGPTTLLGTAVTRTLSPRSGSGVNRNPVIFAGAIGDGGNGNGITFNSNGTGVGVGNFTTVTFGSGASDTAANTYTGLTTVEAAPTRLLLDKADGTNAIAGNLTQTSGQIVLARSNQIADTSVVTVTGGLFDLGGNSETIASLALSGGTTTVGNGTLTTSGGTNTVTNNSAYTLGINLGGTNNLIKNGAGMLYMSGNNSYSGGTLIQNASTPADPTFYGVVLQAHNALGTGPLTIGDATTSVARLALNGYNQTVSALSSGSVGIRVVEANGSVGGAVSTLTVDQTTDTIYSGIIRNNYNTSGQLALVKSGSGTLTFSGLTEYTGTTTVTAGTLALATAVATPITVGSGAFLGLTPGLTVTSTAAVNLSAGKVKIIGAPSAPTSYTLLTTTSTITGPVVLDTAIPDYALVLETPNTLKLNYTGAGSNYATWATSKGIAGEAFNDDFDDDGISNGVEYALDLDPTVSSQPAGVLSGNTISFAKGEDAITNADVSWVIETSTTLAPGSWDPAVTHEVGDPATTIEYTFTPGSPAKNFARLKVVQTTP